MTLTSCGGDQLNIIAQVPVVLSQGERQTDAVVLVQKDAPHDVLLGTDLQAQLGFSLMLESHGRRVDLLREDGNQSEPKDQATLSSSPPKPPVLSSPDTSKDDGSQDCEVKRPMTRDKDNTDLEPPPVGVVRLLQNVKVPPGYMKIVRAKMEGEIERGLLI